MYGYIRSHLSLRMEISFSHLLREKQEKKGGNGEPRGTPDADRMDMWRIDLDLED